MRTEYLKQPFSPDSLHLGNQLKSLLMGEEGHFDKFTALIAFVKFSGVSRIFNALQHFRDTGGQSTIIAGIDQRGTTKQGLEYLRQVVSQVFIYRDEAPERRTFHSKVYSFEETNVRAVLIVGSGNLTAGGLFTNYETHIRLELDLTDEEDRGFYETVQEVLALHSDTTSEFVHELNDDFLSKILSELTDETISFGGSEQGGNETDIEQVDKKDSDTSSLNDNYARGLFGRSKYTRAPKPDISLGVKKVPTGMAGESSSAASPPAFLPPATHVTATLASSVPAVPLTPTGFWKVLSGNDVSTTSSPGQIIIPIEFKDFFEPLTLTKPPDAGGKGRQWEASFSVQFVDGTFRIIANDARCIIYEPETGHPRPNTECRFTFRNREILKRLGKGDILVFRVATGGGVKFLIDKLSMHMPWYLKLYAGKGRKWGTLS